MKDLEKFLRDNAPETPDEGQFMIETNAKLDAVEGIKKTVDGERRRWRIGLIAALVAGLVFGCLATLLIMFYPVQTTQSGISAFGKAIEAMQGWKEVFMGFIACCAITLGVLLMTKEREVL